MKKPLCRLCGERHYTHEPHIFGSEPTKPHINDARKAVAEKREVRRKIDAAKDNALEAPSRPSSKDEKVHVAAPVSDGVAPSSKSDRLAVAKEALTGAERSQKYREAHREEYNAKAKERMKARRAKIRGSPSE